MTFSRDFISIECGSLFKPALVIIFSPLNLMCNLRFQVLEPYKSHTLSLYLQGYMGQLSICQRNFLGTMLLEEKENPSPSKLRPSAENLAICISLAQTLLE
jgi:hypothetical protein